MPLFFGSRCLRSTVAVRRPGRLLAGGRAVMNPRGRGRMGGEARPPGASWRSLRRGFWDFRGVRRRGFTGRRPERERRVEKRGSSQFSPTLPAPGSPRRGRDVRDHAGPGREDVGGPGGRPRTSGGVPVLRRRHRLHAPRPGPVHQVLWHRRPVRDVRAKVRARGLLRAPSGRTDAPRPEKAGTCAISPR